ncbi:site-specific integrase [Methanobrevibacter sp.]|uniref:site-specific integrase n=1 Tax=Methanobrevibacter sp. TaxID=66852 RepID=UPI0038704E26
MDNELLEEIHMMRNHAKRTREVYKDAVNKYTTFCSMSLEELLKEAEAEEDAGVKWKKRKLKRRLLTFRQHLLENYALNTVNTLLRPILTIYKYFEIELFPLPPVNKKNVTTSEPIRFSDLPDKELLRKALSVASPLMSAIICFMVSSGCAKREVLNLTIGEYIKALSDYTDKKDIYEIIEDLGDAENVVPTFNIRRQKTDKHYTTYCSPEAVNAINSYLLSRNDPLTNDKSLFKINSTYLSEMFVAINDGLGFGKVGYFNRLRSHMLRKFHASALYNDGMSLDDVNDLQGKAKNKTDQSYFMTNPEDLKYEYIKHLHAVTISKEVEKLSIKSPEFMQMENEKNKLESELVDIRKEMDDVREMKRELEGLKAKVGK